MDNHSEPKLFWTRLAAFLALFHAFYYSLTADTIINEVLMFDMVVILAWALGGNGRAMVIDFVRHWKGGK